jgi:hypothetical protein
MRLRRVIEDRRGPALKLALALQIGFLRMTGRLLEAVRIVPPALWRHQGEQLCVAATPASWCSGCDRSMGALRAPD